MADELLLKSDANGKSSCGYDRRLWQAALLSFLIGFILFPIAGYFLIRKYSFLAGLMAFSGPAAGSLLLLAAVLAYSGSFKKMFQTLDLHPLPLLICLVVLPAVALAITLSGGWVGHRVLAEAGSALQLDFWSSANCGYCAKRQQYPGDDPDCQCIAAGAVL